MAVLDSAFQEADIATAREVLSRTEFPPELVLQSIETGEDHSGDPALWITISVRLTDGALPERGRMRELAAFISDRVGDILAAGVRSWPYPRLTETAG